MERITTNAFPKACKIVIEITQAVVIGLVMALATYGFISGLAWLRSHQYSSAMLHIDIVDASLHVLRCM